MTLPELETALKTVCPDVYELAAPPGLSQYVVYQAYGFETVFGDDCNMIDAPKVQIDILWQSLPNSLMPSVLDKLRSLSQPFTVVGLGYDDEYAAMRCTLELVVV